MQGRAVLARIEKGIFVYEIFNRTFYIKKYNNLFFDY